MGERPRVLLVPVFARAPSIDAGMPAGEALHVILNETLGQVNANVPVVRAENSEGLHQLRVGLRRLRTALTLTDLPGLAELDVRAKAIIGRVGPARDLDVFMAELFQPAADELGARRGFDLLADRAERMRQNAWKAAITTISSRDFRAFADDAAAAAKTLAWPDTAIGAAAPALLDRALRRAVKRGRHFNGLDPPARHRLRIALKKLRYAAEFFAPLYTMTAVKPWLAPLKQLQDMLGQLNDVAEVLSVLERLLRESGEPAKADLSHAAGLLQGFHQARGETIARKAHKRWKAFRDAHPFWA